MNNHVKPLRALALLLALACLLAGCAVTPPEVIGGTPAQTPEPDAIPAAAAPDETLAPSGSGTASVDPAQALEPTSTQPQATLPPSGSAPTQVEVYYSGAFSMMGFADAPSATIYENTMDALAACVSLCWPTAQANYYRYSQQMDKQSMRHSKETLLASISSPSFYRDSAMTEQPSRVKAEGAAAQAVSERMNEPIPSFYEAAGLTPPSVTGSATGTAVALEASDSGALTIIVTDLHELRTDDGALLSALNHNGLSAGQSIGLVAIVSEFSGYIPDVGVDKTAFVWGAPPSGTLEAVLDYEHYKVGISIDPATRQTRARPFYILCIGDQAAVGAYVQTLADRLAREFQGNTTFALETAMYGSSYVKDGYALAGNLRYTGGDGVTAMADANAPAGVQQVELKASARTRYLEWELTYAVHPSDPRAGTLKAQDFLFEARARTEQGEVELSGLAWSLISSTEETVTLRLRLEFPSGVLAKGSYTLALSGALIAPQTQPGSEWAHAFGWDADGVQLMNIEQNLAPFDGSRTLFLSRLIDALGMVNLSRLGGASLGEVTLVLTVYA